MQGRSTLHLLARACSVTAMGQDIYVVGNVPELGNWNPANAVELSWIDSDTWRGPVVFKTSKGAAIQYEFIMKQGGSVTWKNGSNRSYTVPSSGTGFSSGNWQY